MDPFTEYVRNRIWRLTMYLLVYNQLKIIVVFCYLRRSLFYLQRQPVLWLFRVRFSQVSLQFLRWTVSCFDSLYVGVYWFLFRLQKQLKKNNVNININSKTKIMTLHFHMFIDFPSSVISSSFWPMSHYSFQSVSVSGLIFTDCRLVVNCLFHTPVSVFLEKVLSLHVSLEMWKHFIAWIS